MTTDLLHPAQQLVQTMDRIYRGGMTTTSGGNLSLVDDEGDLWITPSGVDKGTLTPRDIMQVRPDGQVVGPHRPSVELPFHQWVYQARPDLRAIVHAHPPPLIAFSVARRVPDTLLTPGVRRICGRVDMAEYAVPGSAELGARIARVFAAGCDVVMLENHGVVVGAPDLLRAFLAFETLDFAARLERDACRLGAPVRLTEADVARAQAHQAPDLAEVAPPAPGSRERAARQELVTLVHRAYDQRLLTGAQGSCSRRLDARAFVITPAGEDRRHLSAGDLVRVEDGRREAGKAPSRSVRLHQEIYRQQPHVQAIAVAHPPSLMAFAVTRAAFDSRLIPESYIALRSVTRLPFGAALEPARTAAVLRKEAPVALVENDCVVVTGTSLLQAFDRLEVAEYTARALIDARGLGGEVLIDAAQVAEIERAFPL